MNLIDETVAEFGRSLGMPGLTLRGTGSVVLSLQSIGTLALDVAGPTQEAVVVSLSRPLAHPAAVDGLRLLSRSHYRFRAAQRLQLGVRRDQLVLAVVLSQQEFTLEKIHEVVRALDQHHQAMEASS
jgi:type III secretion system chaperone SycN